MILAPPPFRPALSVIRSLVRSFVQAREVGIGVAGVVIAAAVAPTLPLLAQTGPLSQDDVVAACEAGDPPSCTNAGGHLSKGAAGLSI